MPSDAVETLTLAADFPQAAEADWRKLVDGVLKGAPFEKLVAKTYDGIAIQPLYPRAKDSTPIAGRAAGTPWQIMQRIDHPDPKAANAQALHDLENGGTGLTLVFAGANGARGFGLPATAEAIATLLDGIFIDAGIAIELNIGPESRMAATYLAEHIRAKAIDPAKCDIRFGLDPIGACAVWGSSSHDWADIASAVTGTIKALSGAGFKGPFAAADGRVIHDAGGSEAQELAYVLGVALLYLRVLEWSGIPLEDARTMISARLSADADQFLTMAKFRALRRLWARVEESCGLTPKPLFVFAETAWRMLTQRDPYVNMLRATMATFAAGVAGADAITVLPHTIALGLPDAFARRAARNTQLVLLEESNLAKVDDPAAGSGAIETLTDELCASAWAVFQQVEKAGGAFAALEQGIVQSKVAATRAARQASIARRREALTGASEFPNLQEAQATVLPVRASPSAAYGKSKIKFSALTPVRLAQPFEALRDKSDAIFAKHGARPKVLLVTLGTPADYTPRLTFAKSFFETGGIEAVEMSLRDSLADALAPSLICLCSSDKTYAIEAEAAAKALQKAGARHIYLAGKPGEMETALRAAGVADFVAAGGDAVATLNAAYDRLVSA